MKECDICIEFENCQIRDSSQCDYDFTCLSCVYADRFEVNGCVNCPLDD